MNNMFNQLKDEGQTLCFLRALLKLHLSTNHRLAEYNALLLNSEMSFLLPIRFQTLKVRYCFLGYYTVHDCKVVPTFRKKVPSPFQGY